MRAYNQYISPLTQSAKQRATSELAESKWCKRNPLTESYYPLKVNSEFSQNVMMNRYLMRNVKSYGDLSSYTNSMYEVRKAAA